MKYWFTLVSCLLLLVSAASATVEKFTMTTDDSGYAKESESVPFGTYTVNNFSVSHVCEVDIVLDGVSKFKKWVTPGTNYAVSNGVAKKSVDLIVNGADAKATIEFTVDYKYSAFSASRADESFVVTTDADGNAAEEDSVPFGRYTINYFVSSHSFAQMDIVVDGNSAFTGPVTAGVRNDVAGIARSSVVMTMTGGPAKTDVTFAVNYNFSPFRAEDARYTTARDSDTLDMVTDGNGNASASESISFGTFTCKSFTSTHKCKMVKVVLDGSTVLEKEVDANVKYPLTGSARKVVDVIVNGAPANTKVTFTVEYGFSPRNDKRDREVMTFDTDAEGGAVQQEEVPFGKLTVKSFAVNQAFGKGKIMLDGVVGFEGAVVAGKTYPINKAARKNVVVEVEGGPAHKTVECTVDYSFSPFRLHFADIRTYKIFRFKAKTNHYGEVSVPETFFDYGKVLIHGFSSSIAFTKATIILDDFTLFPPSCGCSKVEADKLYELNKVLEPGKHMISAFAVGEQPDTEFVVTVYYE